MKLGVKITATLVSLAVLGAMAAGAYYLFKLVADLYAKLEVQIGPVVGLGSLVLLLSALAVASGMRDARRRTIEKQLVRDKAALYERIIHEWVDAHGRGTGMTELVESLQGLERSLALRAGPAVLKVYAALKTLQETSGTASPDLRAQIATVIIEMRKDLGLSNQGLKSREQLQTLLGVSGMGRERTEESTRLSCETTAMR